MKVYLETDRLILRQFTEDDVALLVDLDSDPEVMRYLGPHTVTDVEAYYRERIRTKFLDYYARSDGLGIWAALERSGGEFLGWLCMRPAMDHRFADVLEFRAEEAELGYRFRRCVWGKGYATEGARALVRKAFVELHVPWVVSTALAANVASTRVMEKAGLKYVGQFMLPGFEEPAVKYVLSKDEFERSGS